MNDSSICQISNPEPGNALIKKDNKEMNDDLLNYARIEMKNRGIIISGDSETMGIGAMTVERWKSFYEMMRDEGIYPKNLNFLKSFTLEFVNNEKWVNFENNFK